MSFLEHLEELRTRLILSLLFLFLGCIAGFIVAKPAFNFLIQPFEKINLKRTEEPLKVRIQRDGTLRLEGWPQGENAQIPTDYFKDLSTMRIAFYLPETPADSDQKPDYEYGYNLQKPVFLSALDPIMIYFKMGFLIGLVFALPLIMHQVWLFVGPGLKHTEKRIMVPILCLGAVLFPIGAMFAWYMFKLILNFLLNFQIVSMEPMLEINKFISLEMRLMLGFGVIFELPVVIMFLTIVGVVEPITLRKYRPHSIVAIAVMAMLFTPPDPFTMLTVMLPLIILYEASIWASVPLARRRKQREKELFEEDELEDDYYYDEDYDEHDDDQYPD